jgi:hypothetical protein
VDREYTSIAVEGEHFDYDTVQQPTVCKKTECSIDQEGERSQMPSLTLSEFAYVAERETCRIMLDEDIGLEMPVDFSIGGIGSPGTSQTFREAKMLYMCKTGMASQAVDEFGIRKKSARRKTGNDAIPPPTLLTSNNTAASTGASLHPCPKDETASASAATYQPGEKLRGRCNSTPPVSQVVNLRGQRQGLDTMLSFGDILSIRGNGRLARLGETGGFLGHVLLVTSSPTRVEKHSREAQTFFSVWPHVDVTCIWQVPVIESTRGVIGLLESTLLLYRDPKSGQITVLGDVMEKVNGNLEIAQCDSEMPEGVEIWRCPPELRKLENQKLMRRALNDLKASEASWSWTTAVRAFLLEGKVEAPVQDASSGSTACFDRTLEDIQACWTAEPICTSVVITFWQRYLCHLVAHTSLPGIGNNELAAVLQYMPLKADRALPGELLTALRSHNWENIARVPLAADPNAPLLGPAMFRINSH